MAYTRHGHPIPGTVTYGPAVNASRCGGIKTCPKCQQDVKEYMTSVTGSGVDYTIKAKAIVREYLDKIYTDTGSEPPVYELYVPWFSKNLQNWKATVGTTMPDGLYFELTYDGDKKVTYLDSYRKFDNVTIPDQI